MALALSSILVTLVTTLFFVQNEFYADVVLRSHVQENARAVTNFMASEVRGLGMGAFSTAGSRKMTVRRPLVLGVVCDLWGDDVAAYLPAGQGGVAGEDVGGYALRDPGGEWTYYPETWANLDRGDSLQAAVRCLGNGSDTTGAVPAFRRLRDVNDTPNPLPEVGTVVMVYQLLDYELKASELAEGTLGLYRGNAGDTLQELATGLTSDSQFSYRVLGDTAFRATVTGPALDSIVAIRLETTASSAGRESAGEDPYTFGFTLDVMLKNVE